MAFAAAVPILEPGPVFPFPYRPLLLVSELELPLHFPCLSPGIVRAADLRAWAMALSFYRRPLLRWRLKASTLRLDG